jgi:dienelactone hydrolase
MSHLPRTLALLLVASLATLVDAEDFPPIARVLPPEGMELPADVGSRLEAELAKANGRFADLAEHPLSADVEIYLKAVRYALFLHEFYDKRDVAKCDAALAEANKRIDSLLKNEAPWERQTGLVVRGYRSAIDGSAQPYGLVIPADHNFGKPCPLYVWLHGRGDKNTDLHFIADRAAKAGQIAPPGAIVAHPFGRQCVGFKSAGEIDVLDVARQVQTKYNTDPTRTVLIGFSMGGAGAWHVGAHYMNHWIAVSPGAGFADVATYQKLTPDKYPPWYEQKLWGMYDVPDYVRDLFNINVIAYSGENDKQIQAARLMEQAYAAEGRKLTHLIGPGVEHKYEPKTLQELLKRLAAIVAKGPDRSPGELHLQTRTLRYDYRIDGLEILALDEHWLDSRIDAELVNDQLVRLKTKNIAAFSLAHGKALEALVEIDGDMLMTSLRPADGGNLFVKRDGHWVVGSAADRKDGSLHKRHGLQGPIDDAFLSPFLVVLPTGKSSSPALAKWARFEAQHFSDRWQALMRGDLRVINDTEISAGDLEKYNLVLFGDPESNAVWKRLNEQLPIRFAAGS